MLPESFTPVLRFDNSNTGNSGGIFGSDRPNLLRGNAPIGRTRIRAGLREFARALSNSIRRGPKTPQK